MMCRSVLSVLTLLITLHTSISGPSIAMGIVINEVYYDHEGGDEGWEYVELYNPEDFAINLEGWSILSVDGASAGRTLLWRGTEERSLGSREFLIIGGVFQTSDESCRLADRLENGPDCVMLLKGETTCDLVGYGEMTLPGLFEGDPAVDVASGVALSRCPDGVDSGNNLRDFVPAEPSPGEPNFYSIDIAIEKGMKGVLHCRGKGIELTVTLVNRGLTRAGEPADVTIISGKGEYLGGATLMKTIAPGEKRTLDIVTSTSTVPVEDVSAIVDYPGDMNRNNDTVIFSVAESPGDIIINEVMPRPDAGGCEWVELFNRSNLPVSVSGWRLIDSSGSEGIVPHDAPSVQGGSYLILAADMDLFDMSHPLCPSGVTSLEGRWPILNDSGETADALGLYDGKERLVEKIKYGDLYGQDRGISLERFSPDVCSCIPDGIWLRSGEPGGSSPGRENSVLTMTIEPGGTVSLSTDCISIKTGVELAISGTLATEELGVRILIYDLDGILVRRLYASMGGAKSFGCHWSGDDDNGRQVGTGLYICIIEFLGQGGVLCRRVKESVAVYDGW